MLSGDICPVWLSSVFLFACVLLILFFFFEALSLFFCFFLCVCFLGRTRGKEKKKTEKKSSTLFFAGQTLCRKPYIYKLKEIMKKEA